MIKEWIKKLIKEIQKEDNESTGITMVQHEDMNDKYIYDFRAGTNFGGNWGTPVEDMQFTAGSVDNTDGSIDPSKIEYKPAPKIVMKPIEVVGELERIPKAFDLEMLDEKIEILNDKEKLINQHYAKREVVAMKERLENRKVYAEYREFFEQFDNTDDGKIQQLLKKYELVMEKSDIFIPDFPKEAIDIMKDYEGMMLKVCDKKPIFYVIAEKEKFDKAYDKRDPILLVQSPFGFYYQILGAWDEELVLLSEL